MDSRVRASARAMNRGATIGAALLAGIVLIGALAPSARAASVTTVTISDSSVDVKQGTASWLDIVSASVSAGKTGNFSFSITVMSSIPTASALSANNTGIVEWFYCLQVNSSFTVSGWPTPNGNGNTDLCQYFLVVVWTGSGFVSVAVNRTPELTGSNPTLTIIPFSIQSASVLWSVDRNLIGSPTSFGFFAASETEQKADFTIVNSTVILLFNGNNAIHIPDFDEASGGGLAQWP
jgi:hypothetical protein